MEQRQLAPSELRESWSYDFAVMLISLFQLIDHVLFQHISALRLGILDGIASPRCTLVREWCSYACLCVPVR
jgi:hypothetical protein